MPPPLVTVARCDRDESGRGPPLHRPPHPPRCRSVPTPRSPTHRAPHCSCRTRRRACRQPPDTCQAPRHPAHGTAPSRNDATATPTSPQSPGASRRTLMTRWAPRHASLPHRQSRATDGHSRDSPPARPVARHRQPDTTPLHTTAPDVTRSLTRPPGRPPPLDGRPTRWTHQAQSHRSPRSTPPTPHHAAPLDRHHQRSHQRHIGYGAAPTAPNHSSMPAPRLPHRRHVRTPPSPRRRSSRWVHVRCRWEGSRRITVVSHPWQ